MFRSILKYTPLLKRCLICVLALFLLLGVFCRPITVKAAIGWDPVSSALWAALVGSGLFSEGVNSGFNLIQILTQELVEGILGETPEQTNGRLALLKLFTNLTGNAKFSLNENERSSLLWLIWNSSARHLITNFSQYKSQEEVPLVQSGTQLYVPTEEAMQDMMSITQMQVLYEGFVNEQIEVTKETNSILNQMRIFLGTMDLELKAALNKHFADLSLSLNEKLESVAYRVEHVSQTLVNTRTALETSIQELKESLTYRIDNVHTAINKTTTAINDFKSALAYRVDNVTGAVNSLKTEIGNQFSGLSKKFDQLLVPFPAIQESLDQIVVPFPAIKESLDQIVDKIPTFDQIEIEKPQHEVLVGQQQILVTDYLSMGQAFSAKMAWVPQIFDFLSELRSRLNSGTPPKVPIKLSAAEGSINWGEDSYILDMSWYARYKPSVDTILSGIMWLCCGWAIYKRIPDILSGVGITVENATQDAGHVWTSRAERAERNSRYKGG